MKTHMMLKKYFDRKKKSSPAFSMRALAGRLKISAPFLSRVLNGKKPIPKELLKPLAKALDVEPEMMASMIRQHSEKEKSAKIDSGPSGAFTDWDLAEDQAAKILRNWYYLPIVELTTLTNSDGSVKEIADRLGLSLTTTQIALRELESLGIVYFKNNRYFKAKNKFRITSSKSTPLIRKFHDEMLERSQLELRNAISEEDFQRRLITGITLTADEEKVRLAKKKLANFLYELANELIESPGTEVYHLSAQLFPLSRKK